MNFNKLGISPQQNNSAEKAEGKRIISLFGIKKGEKIAPLKKDTVQITTNQTELDSIVSYYRYNGNRIDNYGTFDTYWGLFVRGKIIISNNYTQPEIDELNRRLELGIFTQEV